MTNTVGFFHRNFGGSAVAPLNEEAQRLLDAGITPLVTVIGEAGHAAELADMGCLVAFAIDSWRFAPSYKPGTAWAEGQARWEYIRPRIPPEIVLRKDSIWLIVLNEPDQLNPVYVFNFMLSFTQAANADGYKVTGPNWSAGTPFVDAWERPQGLQWLRYCAENPDMASIGIHEYSLDATDIRAGYPYLIGRHQFILDICDEHNIPHPPFLICEFGYTYDEIPAADTVVRQLAEPDGDEPSILELYEGIPFAFWTVGGWDRASDLPRQVASLITPLADWYVANHEPEPPDPPPPVDWRTEIWEESVIEQIQRGIPFNLNHGLHRLIAQRPGYALGTRESAYTTSDGVRRGYQVAEHMTDASAPRLVLTYPRPWTDDSAVEVLTDGEAPEPPPEPGPEPFAFHAWPTDYKVITQTFGNNPAYYGQFGLPGHEGIDVRAPHGSPIYAVAAGRVYLATGDEGNYGRQVRVDHGDGWKTVYAHNVELLVAVGDVVTAGQQIARADSTGNSSGSHLHLTLKRDGHSAPGYPNDIIDPTPFILDHRPQFPNLPPPTHGLTLCDVSAHQGAIDFHKMMRRGVYGCYIRGTVGGTGLDNRHAVNWQDIAETPMLRGMYHLFRSDSTALANLRNIQRAVAKFGHGDLKIAIDVEPVTNLPRIDGDRVAELLTRFRNEFGYEPLVYSGLWVRDRVDGDRSWFKTALLWLAAYWQAPPKDGQYPAIPEGNTLDRLLAHQWTSSFHDGRTWGVESIGLDINVAYDLDRLLVGDVALPDPPSPPDPPEPPPPTIDLLPYLEPVPGGNGPLYELRRESGAQERVQTQSDQNSNRFYVVKGSGGIDGKSEWEELSWGSGSVWRGKDTSPGNGQYYHQYDDGQGMARWTPRHMSIGQVYERNPWVEFRRKSDCGLVRPRARHYTTIKLVDEIEDWVSPQNSSIVLDSVIVLEVYHADGRLFERSFYALGYGLVGFEGESVRSFVSDLHAPGSRPNNVRESGCFS